MDHGRQVGIRQLLAGSRKFNVSQICRNDIYAGNRETARETGITYITDAKDESARNILLS